MIMENITGEAGGGLVTIVYDNLGRPLRVEIADEIFTKDDKDFISDLFVAAINDGYKKLLKLVYDKRAQLDMSGKQGISNPLV